MSDAQVEQETTETLLETPETVQEATKVPAKAQAPRPVVEVTEDGYLRAKDLEGKLRIANGLFKSGMVPKGYDTPEKVFAAMEFAQELGLKPFSGIRYIAMINGMPSIWGDLPLALARQTGELEGIEEFVFDKDYKRICFDNKNLNAEAWGAVCFIKRKSQPVVEGSFTMDDAQNAKLLGKETPWKTYPKIMLTRRARSMALKTAFGDALSSIPIAEYDYNTMPQAGEMREVTHQGTKIVNKAQELNQLFG